MPVKVLRTASAPKPSWGSPTWDSGTMEDPDHGWVLTPYPDPAYGSGWVIDQSAEPLSDDAILVPLEEQFGQTRSKERIRELAEVFTHQREVDAMLDLVPDAFELLDVKFLEPACGSGNFLVEILARKLQLVTKADCVSQQQYEHQLLRAISSIYGVDISQENVTESRARMAHVLLSHFQTDANTVQPTIGFLSASALILGDNIVCGDTLTSPQDIELCEWQPRSHGCFQRLWSPALVPEDERDLFWEERLQDVEPVHYSQLVPETSKSEKGSTTRRGRTQ